MGRSFRISFFLFAALVALSAVGLSTVIAAVQTDQADYSPGSVVTISGDNSNDAGYLASEAVDVAVTGPNGYAASCEAIADAYGAWTCQITLWDDDRAIGSYQYTATGRESAVSETGTFTDARNWNLTFAGTGTGTVKIAVSAGTVNAPTGCGGSGVGASSQTVSGTCSPNITTSDNNAIVTFTATAAAGSTFGGWSGQANLTASPSPGCTGTSNPCSVVIGANGTLTVTFNAVATNTPSPTATATITPTPTTTATGTATHTPTNTATHTLTHTATATPSPTETSTPTATFTSTFTPTPTNVPPDADAGGPYAGDEGAPIALSASGSSDSDGTITDYEWDLDNDTQFDDAFTELASVTFGDDGSYTVGVRVTDDDDASDTDTATVVVGNLEPLITGVDAVPSTVDEGGASVISVDATDVPADVPDLRYSFDCEDDGTYDFIDQMDDFAGCAFPDGPATVTVRVRIDDQDGGVTTDTVDVTVDNLDPVITSVTANPSTVDEGTNSEITVVATDVAADLGDLLYSFDCEDDGTYDFVDQSEDAADCTFADGPASVAVRVRIDDQDGGVVTSTVDVTVDNLDPVISDVDASPSTVDEGNTSVISVSATDVAADLADLRYSFDCDGDATYDTGPQAASSASCLFPDGPASVSVGVKVIDQDGGEAGSSVSVTVLNVAPVVVVSGDFSDVDEGQTRTYSYTVTDVGDDTPAVTEDCGESATLVDTAAPLSFDCTFPDGPDSTTINVTADDGDSSNNIGDDPNPVTINNVAPVVTAGAVTGNEGDSVSESASFSDVGVLDTHTCAIAWGDGDTTAGTVSETGGSGTCSGSHVYADNSSYTVEVTVTDNDAAPGGDTDTASIANVAPTATLGNDGPVDEGSPATVSFTGASDPSTADTAAGFHYAFACDNGSLATATYAGSGTSASTACTYADNGSYTVRARIIDKDGGATEYTTVVTVDNVAPVVTAGAVSGNEGASVSESASFSDVGVLDTHTCAIAWGDGDTTAGTVSETGGSGTCSGLHVYADNGSYTVEITVTDDDADDGADTDTATIANVAPTVNAGADQSVTWTSGGNSVTLAAPPSFGDPGADTHTCSVAWGDGGPSSAGSVAETVGNPTSGTCAATHFYALPGVYTVVVTVCDDDTQCGTDTLLITSGLVFYGFLQPLNDPAISTNTPSVWKRGSNIPLKFQLRDANGAPIPESLALAILAACPGQGARVSIAKLPPGSTPPVWATEAETSSSPTADGGTCFRYDGSGQFHYNLGTKTPFYTVLPDAFKATATVTYNGGVIASHTQANTFGLK